MVSEVFGSFDAFFDYDLECWWNGNALYMDKKLGEREYLATRTYLSDMIPELIHIPEEFTKTQW